MKDFSTALLNWYDKNKRDLPWRHTKDPYKIWISEVMLQQTTVNAVIPYYNKWIKTYPTIFCLAKASLQKILKSWQGLGYYNRAKNLHKAANLIVSNYNGSIPADQSLVQKLPGFGPYTSGAVLSIAYDLPLIIIDANIRRVFMRILAIKGLSNPIHDCTIRGYLSKIFPKKRSGDFNQALMELGALVCRNRAPLCNICAVREFCKAYKTGKQETIPLSKKKDVKEILAVIAIIKNKDKFLFQKRPPGGLLGDLWELPGGKVEKKENRAAALVREIKEELQVQVKTLKYLFDVKHTYTQFRVTLSVYDCQLQSLPRTSPIKKWVSSQEFFHYPMPSGTVKILIKLGILKK